MERYYPRLPEVARWRTRHELRLMHRFLELLWKGHEMVPGLPEQPVLC